MSDLGTFLGFKRDKAQPCQTWGHFQGLKIDNDQLCQTWGHF